MKKNLFTMIVAVTLSNTNLAFSENLNGIHQDSNWRGFYLGGNAGYWQSQTDKVNTTGSANFINQTFALGTSNIADALVQIANNHFSLHPHGFIGGAQVGYNYQSSKGVVLGFNIDFDGLTNSGNSYTLQKSVDLVDFAENYVGSLSVTQKINSLGTVRARVGYLFYPTLLVYATGGFAYGNVTLNTAWTAQESLGAAVFPAVVAQNNLRKTLTGWTAGAGIEWLFKPNWSTSLEYTYYDLNGLNAPATLAQTNESISPPVLWASVIANTRVSLSVGTIRLGINYHFA